MFRISRHRTRRALLAASTLALLVAGPMQSAHADARAFSPLVVTLNASTVSVPGTPYHMNFSVESNGDQWTINVEFTRTAATGNHPTQTHTWMIDVPGADVHVATDLSTASIHTHSDLAKYGSIDLTLHNPGTLSTHKNKCPNGTVTGTTSARSGSLTGTFAFDANDGYFDQVNRTSFALHVTRVVNNGKQCPAGPVECNTGKDFVGGDQGVAVFASRPLRGGTASLDYHLTQIDLPAVIGHDVRVTAPRTDFILNKHFLAAVDGDGAMPFAEGDIAFTKDQTPTTTTSHHCKVTSAHEAYSTGSTTVHFDSGGDQSVSSGTGTATKIRTV